MTAPELPNAPEADAVGAPVEQPVRLDPERAGVAWELALLAQTLEFSDDVRAKIQRGADEIERLQADHARMNALDEEGREWTFWMGKTTAGCRTTFFAPPGQDIRSAIDWFYKLKA